MIPQSITAIQNGHQLIQLPDENIVRIFGFLDIKSLGVVTTVCHSFARIQKEGSIWCSLFPQICSFHLELPEKERVRHLQVSLGNPQEFNQCILDFYNKTITEVNPKNRNFNELCLLAFNHPDVPNGSFVVFYNSLQVKSCAVIKSKDGVVGEIKDIKRPNPNANLFMLEVREHEGKPSQFHEFKLILDKNDPMADDYYATFKWAANLLKHDPNKGN